jgi:hypothetical protein
METIQQTLSGSSSTPIRGSASSTCVISRNGDLVYRVYARVKSPNDITIKFGNSIGILNFFDSVELEIGGQLIDRHTGQWMSVWENISQTNDNFEVIWGEKKEYNTFGDGGDINTLGLPEYNENPYRYINVPFNFWFCRNPGLALPLIALQYHEVKIKISTKAEHPFFRTTYALDGSVGSIDYDIFCDYIYLDTDERRRFAQVSHEYLIEQVQIQGGGQGSSQKLNFNHPVKFITWTSQTSTQSITSDATIQLNGHDRFSKQSPEYFYKKQFIDYFNPINQRLVRGHHEIHGGGVPPENSGEYTIDQNHIAGNGRQNDGTPDRIVYTSYRLLDLTQDNLNLINISFKPGWLEHDPQERDISSGGDKKFGIRLWTSTNGDISTDGYDNSTSSRGTHYGYHKTGSGDTYDPSDVPQPNNVASIITPDMNNTGNSVILAANTATAGTYTEFDFVENADGVASPFYIQPGGDLVTNSNYPVISFTFTPQLTTPLQGKYLFITFYTVNAALHGGAAINTDKISIDAEYIENPILDNIKVNVHQYKIVGSSKKHYLNAYSFALKPLEHQPSGTCNFSRIDNAKLIFEGGSPPTIDNIYAVNYNVLRIMSGMGGLAYSN